MQKVKEKTEKQKDWNDYFEQMAQEASLLHPELEKLSAKERQKALEQVYHDDEIRRAKRLKEHIEVFSDAVIGVIITMMLLEIPLPSDTIDLHHFLTGILIFFVSFFIVADFWYDNHKILGQIEHATSKILIVQFNFMATLALIPLFTRWMMEGITTSAVVGYGIVTIAVNLKLFCHTRKVFWNDLHAQICLCRPFTSTTNGCYFQPYSYYICLL